ncbi:MAG: nitroreductase family deazaflavin-dependent oxidoreductase [Vulcanimicrobiota bacterium]
MLARFSAFFLRRRSLVRLVTRFHMLVYRATGGVVGGLIAGVPNLLLTTVGRKSGIQHTTPLFYLPDGDRFIVVASYGGNPNDPAWWKNLQKNPQGWVEIGSQRMAVTAHQADDELKRKMWPVFVRHYPAYNDYQARTDRVIPLVVLKPEQR